MTDKKNLKVMEYNILHGFHNNEKPFVFEEKRFNAAKKVIEKENPDVLILTEACFGSDNKYGIIMDYQKIFNFPHYFHASAEPKEYEWGTALLSKYPIKKAQNLSELWKSCLRTQIDFNGTPINIDVAHPYPDIPNREKEAFFRRILNSRTNSNSYILAGDFNSLSPEDVYNKEKLIKGFKLFDNNPENSVNNLIDGKVVPYLLSNRLVDTYRVINKEFDIGDYTIPTDLVSKDKSSAMRLDYILCSRDFNVEDSKIIKNKNSNIASDHYPITATLSLEEGVKK